MKHHLTLKISSLLSILLFSFHWADEIRRGIEPGTLSSVGGLLILFVWLYGTLVLSDRRLGLVIILFGPIRASGVPILHMAGKGWVGGRIAPDSSGAFFWVWTLIALNASGMISLVLSVGALWSARRNPGSTHRV